jgi:hypothetical protein
VAVVSGHVKEPYINITCKPTANISNENKKDSKFFLSVVKMVLDYDTV